jgi:ferredoxin
VNAIYAEADLPEDQAAFLELNAELAQVWPNITDRKEPLPEAEQWNGVPNKLQYLVR